MKKLKNLNKTVKEENTELLDKYEETISKLEASVEKYKTDASKLRSLINSQSHFVDPEALINEVAECVCSSLEDGKYSKDQREVVSKVAKAVYDLLVTYKKDVI